MATQVVGGPVNWGSEEDDEGTRTYTITFKVAGLVTDGPSAVRNTPGLPRVGDPWAFLGDSDPWCFCQRRSSIKAMVDDEPNRHWLVTFTFTNKGNPKFCRDQQIDDPLLQPAKINGGCTRYSEEATEDRFGAPVVTSSWEQFRGPQNEWDANHPWRKIEINTPTIAVVELAESLTDHVNSVPMWGLGKRCWKLSEPAWERMFYGQCQVYYKLTMTFEGRKKGWDRDLLDEGTKVLNGHWSEASDEWVVDRIGGLFVPQKPTLSSVTETGAALVPATIYAYRISAIDEDLTDGGETLAGAEATVTLAAGKNAVRVVWPPVAGAAGYKVYGRTAGSEKLLATVGAANQWTDNGSAAPGADLPDADTTGYVDANNLNPSHFIRFEDRRGNACKVVLDGAGLPSGVQVRDRHRYMSIYTGGDDGTHQGQALADAAYWMPIAGSISPAPDWADTQSYVAGNVVNAFDGVGAGPFVYIALQASSGIFHPPGDAAYWLKLGDPFGIASLNPPVPNNAGVWKEDEEYILGDYVTAVIDAGKIHIEKYDESDFLALGIPGVIAP